MEPYGVPAGQVTAVGSAPMPSVQIQPLTLRERRQSRLEQYRKSQQKNFFSVRSLQKSITTLWIPLPVGARTKPVLITDTVAILPPPITVDQPAYPKASAPNIPTPPPKKDRWKLMGYSAASLARRPNSSFVAATKRSSIEFHRQSHLTRLIADRFLLNHSTGKVEAEGNVILSHGKDQWEAEYISYNFWSQNFSEINLDPAAKTRVKSELPADEIVNVGFMELPAGRPPANAVNISIPIEQAFQFADAKAAWIEHPNWRNRTLRFSFEEIDMPDAGEHMGLYGIGASDRFKPWLYGGITAYGAASGRRGGFFTGGYTLGVERKLTDDWILDAGGYVGAGGGGAAAQGGGLMIRPHIGLKYDFSWGALGLNYTYVDFPNGDISSDAIALSLDIPFSSPTRSWEDDELTAADYFGADWSNVSRHRSHLAARVRAYSPASGSKTTSGGSLDDSLGLVGVEYSYFLDDNWFTTFETAGAVSGGVGGYAELLAGLGYRQPLTKDDRLALLPALTIGGAGGGGVETGGGFVARANLGLEYRLSPHLSLIMDGGYLTAPDSDFDTPYVGFNLAYVMETFAHDQKGTPVTETDLIQTTKWRFRPAHQWYFDAQRKGGTTSDMQLMGGKIDWMGGDWWYLTGQGLSAYAGGAGGYSEGHWGAGVYGPSWKNWQLYGEMLIGAGGGGGVDSGSALLYKPSIGLEYNLNRDFGLQAGIGKVISKSGNLEANILDASLVWRFGTSK